MDICIIRQFDDISHWGLVPVNMSRSIANRSVGVTVLYRITVLPNHLAEVLWIEAAERGASPELPEPHRGFDSGVHRGLCPFGRCCHQHRATGHQQLGAAGSEFQLPKCGCSSDHSSYGKEHAGEDPFAAMAQVLEVLEVLEGEGAEGWH